MEEVDAEPAVFVDVRVLEVAKSRLRKQPSQVFGLELGRAKNHKVDKS